MIDLRFSIEGGEVVSRRLGITATGISSFRTPFDLIGKNFLKTFDMNFNSRGATYGGWKPRKPQYEDGVRIDTWPLMEKTGKMRRSFRSRPGKDSLTLDNPTSYFVYHQSNATPRTRLPRRVMMKIRQQDATMIVKEVQRYIVEVKRRAGFM